MVPMPPPWVWAYKLKGDKPKACGTCNGSKRYGQETVTLLVETYATCVGQPASHLLWALVAAEWTIALGADVGNAFAEASSTKDPFYMTVDDQSAEWWWWVEWKGFAPSIAIGYVLPVNHALQGQPVAPRLWEKFINYVIVEKLGFTATTHERCLYFKRVDNEMILFLRQVDDFAIASRDKTLCPLQTIQSIGDHLIVPIHQLGIIRKFYGVDILQTHHYVTISCESYINKIIASGATFAPLPNQSPCIVNP